MTTRRSTKVALFMLAIMLGACVTFAFGATNQAGGLPAVQQQLSDLIAQWAAYQAAEGSIDANIQTEINHLASQIAAVSAQLAQIVVEQQTQIAALNARLDTITLTPGPQGPKGDRGDVGPQGLPGERGLPGDRGAQGDRGLAGEPGARGLDGARGADGLPGAKGDQGIQGLPGVAGAKGDKGDRGNDGAPGAASTVPGPKGDQGLPGVAGAKGDKGDPGSQGIQGLPGAASTVPGPKGDRGDVGPAGPAGADGASYDAAAFNALSGTVGGLVTSMSTMTQDLDGVKHGMQAYQIVDGHGTYVGRFVAQISGPPTEKIWAAGRFATLTPSGGQTQIDGIFEVTTNTITLVTPFPQQYAIQTMYFPNNNCSGASFISVTDKPATGTWSDYLVYFAPGVQNNSQPLGRLYTVGGTDFPGSNANGQIIIAKMDANGSCSGVTSTQRNALTLRAVTATTRTLSELQTLAVGSFVPTFDVQAIYLP